MHKNTKQETARLVELAKHFRKRFNHECIKARVRVSPGEYSQHIQVITPKYGVDFTDQEQRTIRTIAKTNGFTLVQGMEIQPDQMTDPEQMNFYYPSNEQKAA